MYPTATKTFSVQFPSVYEHVQPLNESIMAEHRQNDKCLSYINISLQELNTFDDYEGDDLPTRFQAFCLDERGTVEVIADKTLEVAGSISTIRTAQAPNGSFYYFGLLPINSEYGYLFIGDCHSNLEYYEPLFDDIWQSLKYFDKAEPEPISFPANGEEFWQIEHHVFTLNKESQCYISDGDGALNVKIEAQAPHRLMDKENDIITSYDNGKVYLQFYFKGIYNAGIPTGTFHFEDESDNSYLTYLWKGGFQYSLRLTADVILQNGWLTINGNFNEFPFKLAVKLPIHNLDWKNYRFLSTEEVSSASPDLVRHLWLTDVNPDILQETIQPLTQLQVLSIDYRDKKLAAGLTALPTAVQHLTELKDLSLTGVVALESLPQWLGDLKKLETFRLQDSKVEDLNEYIFQLPVLKKLYLGRNELQSIPAVLPENLEHLVLSNNKLTTLPASVSGLKYLGIENNPLQQLPAGLENIPDLDLELEKKIALLNYTYKGADGQGTIAYDDTRFFAKYDPELLSLLEEQINATELNEFKEGLTNRTLRSIALETTEEDTYTVKGNHRFGGLPDLPPGVPYPTFIDWEKQERGLQFIAQINCTAIAHLQDYLPRTGMLYFFITDQEEMGPKVLYYDGDSNNLQSAKELKIDNDFIYEQNGIYTPFRAEAGKYASIPFTYNAHSLYPELAEMNELYKETEQLQAGLVVGTVKPEHGINSYVFKQHGTPEIEAVNKMMGKPEEWMVLLRVSSDNNPGFCFWDAGEIYFVIHKSDLDKKNFSNVYCGLESS
ncbi:DUF1963 domain-containing protein [Niastella sp. OAS944]|uniref:DUF1963 domain-containing protein n=1 Tax=Niastella sp. OAS944 TaxID=2664089 RepID=UPI00348F0B8B|nr:uncharacterized protein YwqG [Chitinophagaceae bacterium OAS944]